MKSVETQRRPQLLDRVQTDQCASVPNWNTSHIQKPTARRTSSIWRTTAFQGRCVRFAIWNVTSARVVARADQVRLARGRSKSPQLTCLCWRLQEVKSCTTQLSAMLQHRLEVHLAPLGTLPHLARATRASRATSCFGRSERVAPLLCFHRRRKKDMRMSRPMSPTCRRRKTKSQALTPPNHHRASRLRRLLLTAVSSPSECNQLPYSKTRDLLSR